MKKLSIITINFNNATGLEKTIETVVSQTNIDFEYIVIDGASSDSSIDIINKYSEQITFWISEKDSGIYHAMNKGIEKATGEYCLFLNSGDYLANENVLNTFLSEHHEEDIIYGNMLIDWGNGKIILGKMPPEITYLQMYNDTLWHPVSFIKLSLFKKYGNYDEKYKMVADYDFFFKTIIMNSVTTKYIPIAISVYSTTGFSSKPENKEMEMNERQMVKKSYLPKSIIQYTDAIVRKYQDEDKKWYNRILKRWKK